MRQSKLCTYTLRDVSKEETSLNAQLLLRGGFVDRLMAGVYSFLPLGMRVLSKIEQIVREEMNALGGQEVLMPALQSKELWVQTGRWDAVDVLFKLKGAGDRDLCLGPTHEEVVTPLVGKFIHSYKDLPKSVYQLQTKFRNEARAKSGLLRGREFRMKDMYSFHATEEDLNRYYDTVVQGYHKVFARCGIGDRTHLTYASGGIFSKYSHEFQTLTEHGEDIVYLCEESGVAINKEIIEDLKYTCPVSGSKNLKEVKAIEVGNIFKLMRRFSDACELSFQDKEGTKQPVYMGCYGLGSSRLMGSIAEILHDDKGICWPKSVAPYRFHLVSLARAEDEVAKIDELYQTLQAARVDVLYDDRTGLSAGEKFSDSDLLGIPTRLVMSSRTIKSGTVEWKERTSADSKQVPLGELLAHLAGA